MTGKKIDLPKKIFKTTAEMPYNDIYLGSIVKQNKETTKFNHPSATIKYVQPLAVFVIFLTTCAPQPTHDLLSKSQLLFNLTMKLQL